MRWRRLAALLALCIALPVAAAEIRIAAAADLRFALDEIAAAFRHAHPQERVEITYGSSGKFHAQIRNGAPFDLFFSADIALPRDLAEAGLSAGPVRPYARGRLALWSATRDASRLAVADLARPEFRRIAIANPRHAPYGARAVEALRGTRVWPAVEGRLVYGENVAQAAQFVQTGNADIGIIALSLAVTPEFAAKGRHALVPASLHQPLDQGFIIVRRAADNALARRFAEHFASPAAGAILARHGFELPDAPPAR
jgi:molybdate transport system substrate-binding protein